MDNEYLAHISSMILLKKHLTNVTTPGGILQRFPCISIIKNLNSLFISFEKCIVIYYGFFVESNTEFPLFLFQIWISAFLQGYPSIFSKIYNSWNIIGVYTLCLLSISLNLAILCTIVKSNIKFFSILKYKYENTLHFMHNLESINCIQNRMTFVLK